MKSKKLIMAMGLAFVGLVASCGGNQAVKSTTTPTTALPATNPTTVENSKTTEKTTTTDKVTLTISNGASSANVPEESVNALHVYTPGPNDDDYLSGAEVEKGTALTVFAYNYSSKVELTIEHGEDKVVRQYNQLIPYVDDDKIEFIEFEAENDVKITTKAITEFTTQTAKLTAKLPEGVEAQFMNVKNPGPDAVVAPLIFNEFIRDEFNLNALFTNTTDKEYELKVTIAGEAYELSLPFNIVSAKADEDGMGGFMIPAADITGDVLVEFVEATTEDDEAFTITANDVEGIMTMFATVSGEDNIPTPITDGKIPAEFDNLRVMFINESGKEYTVTLKINNQEVDLGPIMGVITTDGGGISLPKAQITGNVEITITEKPQASENEVTITIDNQTEQALHVYKASDIDTDLTNGATVSKNEVLNVYPYGDEAVELIIEVGDVKTTYSYEEYYNYTMDESEMIKEFTASDNVKITLKYVTE